MIWWIEAIIASLLTTLIGLAGIIFLSVSAKILPKIIILMVALAAGTLLGDAFIHLIPEAIFKGVNWQLGVIGGILLFFILEKIVRWRHCHEIDCHDKNVPINLVADSIHNLIDGLAIGASFSVDRTLGLATTTAILLHEIPQEIGDFAIMIQGKVGVKKSILLNFLSGLFSFLGVILVIVFGGQRFGGELSAITAGGFIYVAATDLIPELHRHETKISDSMIQLIMVSVGILIMFLLKIGE